MLTRIITSVVGVAILVPVLIYSDTYLFVGAIALACVIGCFEMLRCNGLHTKYVIAIPQYLIAAFMPFLMRLGGGSNVWLQTAIFVHIVFIMYLLAVAVFSHGAVSGKDAMIAFALCLYVNVGFSSIVLLRDFEGIGQYIFLLVFIGAWMTDIFAYFCGLAFGRHKLIPDVSPKKTVEGSVGGIAFCAFAYVVYGYIVDRFFDVELNLIALGVFGIIISVVSQIGDLSASLIKRENNVKDYGSIFPGHGGVMDRFDSVLAVSSVLTVLIYSFSII